MTQISSRTLPVFDITEAGFRGAAGDVGEALAFLAGGLKPDADTLSRLCLSLRGLQGFLIGEAEQQAAREVVLRSLLGCDITLPIIPRPTSITFLDLGAEQDFPSPEPMTREFTSPVEAVS